MAEHHDMPKTKRQERHDLYREQKLKHVPVIPYDQLTFGECIGEGSYGKVSIVHYQGENGQLTRAYKSIKKIGTDKVFEDNRRKFRNEAASQANLDHENIVRLYAIVDETDTFGLIMEYIENSDMKPFIEKHHEFPNVICSIILDVSKGMEYLHKQTPAIIHGDLKMENVLIENNKHAKITDFGMAQWKDYSKSRSSSVKLRGTWSHIAPEYFNRKILFKGEKFDVYSFAILMWETVTNEKVFKGDDEELISIWVQDSQRPNLDVYPMAYPSLLKKLTEDCWQQKPEKRPSFGVICGKLAEISKRLTIGGIADDDDMADGGRKDAAASSIKTASVSDAEMKSVGLSVADVEMMSQNESISVDVDVVNDLKNFPLRTEKSKLFVTPYDGEFGSSQFLLAIHEDWGLTSYKPANFENQINLNYLWREINIQRKLNHTNILKFMGIVFEPEHCGLIFEQIHVRTLKHYVQCNKMIPFDEKLRMLYDVSVGLSYMHSIKPPVIHCCVKPEHVHVGDTHQVKLSDFQFAQEKIQDAKLDIKRFKVNGKPSNYHIPPEYYDKDSSRLVSEEIDVYGFAWVIAEVLNPVDLFKHEVLVHFPKMNRAELVVQSGFRPICKFPEEVPKEIAKAVNSCFKETPDKWPSIENMMTWLDVKKRQSGETC